MNHTERSTPRIRAACRRSASGLRPGRRFLLIAVALSVAVHIAAALLVAFVPRGLPSEVQSEAQGSVELLMVEQKGAEPSQAGQPKDAVQTHPPPPTNNPLKPQDETATSKSPPPYTVPAPPDEQPDSESADLQTGHARPTPTEEDAPDQERTVKQPATPTPATEANAQPLPPQPRNAPIFDLSGTDSESNALALGDHVVPAMRDDRFRNRPPVYPLEAEINDEHGSVTIVIHVSANGTATGADVRESSGYEVLDQAALTAALKWHFHPAIRDGQAVPFDMPFRFIFEPG